nr:hypothetical protein [Tanacetum cinerariifolium]
MILAPGQPIPHGRPYRYHPNGPIYMMTVRKRAGPLLVQQLAVRHVVDHSSSDYFSPDDSARDSSLDSSSDFHLDASLDSSSRHSFLDHSSPNLPSTSAGPSRKRLITPPTTQTDTIVIPTETPIIAPTIPPSPDYTPASPDYSPASDTESDPSEDPSSDPIPPLPATSPFLSSHDDTTDSDTPNTPPSPIHGTPFTEITAFTQRSPRRRSPMTYVPALPHVFGALSHVRADLIPSPKRARDSGYLADVEVGPRETRVERVKHPAMPEDILEPTQEGAVKVTYETLGDLVQRFHDHTQAIPVHRVHVIEGVQMEQGHRIVGVESAVTALTERVDELEGDNRRLRGTVSVESQRVDRLQPDMS